MFFLNSERKIFHSSKLTRFVLSNIVVYNENILMHFLWVYLIYHCLVVDFILTLFMAHKKILKNTYKYVMISYK